MAGISGVPADWGIGEQEENGKRMEDI